MLKTLAVRGITQQSLTISSEAAGYTIAGGSYSVPTAITLTINAGILVRPSATYALSITGTFPSGSTLTIVNNGVIMGNCGNGGAGANYDSGDGAAGGNGGHALYLNYSGLGAVQLDNTSGYVLGGGGGGGGGKRAYTSPITFSSCAGGGGGQGAGYGSLAWASSGTDNPNAGQDSSAQDGGSKSGSGGSGGAAMTAGAGGDGEARLASYSAYGSSGGNGGGFGAAGDAGVDNSLYGRTGSAGAGGAAGKACYIVAGSLTITGGNNSTQIKGALS